MTNPPEDAYEAAVLREQLAAIEHERWAHWQRWMHGAGVLNLDGSLTIPVELVKRWERQIATPYADLSEREQASDREQVDRYWPLIVTAVDSAYAAGVAAGRSHAPLSTEENR